MRDMRLVSLFMFVLFLVIQPGANGNSPVPAKPKEFKALSPNGKTTITITVGETLSYQVELEGIKIIEPSQIGMVLSDGTGIPGANPSLKSNNQKLVNNTINASVYKKSMVSDYYNLLVLTFKEGSSIEFRVYDDGVAYRFLTSLQGTITVKEEKTEFNFGRDHTAWIQYVNRWGKGDKYYTTFENAYVNVPLSKTAGNDSLIVAPVVIDLGSRKVAITDADLEDYPGMFLQRGKNEFSLEGSFAPVPRTTSISGNTPAEEGNLEAVVSGDRYDYIAITQGTRSFPWRAIVIVENDIQLADNDMVYRLASPSRISDES